MKISLSKKSWALTLLFVLSNIGTGVAISQRNLRYEDMTDNLKRVVHLETKTLANIITSAKKHLQAGNYALLKKEMNEAAVLIKAMKKVSPEYEKLERDITFISAVISEAEELELDCKYIMGKLESELLSAKKYNTTQDGNPGKFLVGNISPWTGFKRDFVVNPAYTSQEQDAANEIFTQLILSYIKELETYHKQFKQIQDILHDNKIYELMLKIQTKIDDLKKFL